MSTRYSYTVRVGNMARYQEPGEEYKVGEFESCAKAIEKCLEILSEFLPTKSNDHISAEELLDSWMRFGEDPYIVTNDPNCEFSAQDYLRELCRNLTP